MPSPFSNTAQNPFAIPSSATTEPNVPAGNPQGTQETPTSWPGGSQVPASGGNPTDPTAPNGGLEADLAKVQEAWDYKPKPEEQEKDAITTMTQEQIAELSGNFQPTIDQAALAEAMSNNDSEAVAQIMAKASQEAYASAMAASSSISNNYIEQERARSQERMTRQQREDSVTSELSKANEAFKGSGPIAAFGKSLVRKFMQKHPDADPTEAAQAINAYVTSKMGGKPETSENPNTQNKPNAPEVDWAEF